MSIKVRITGIPEGLDKGRMEDMWKAWIGVTFVVSDKTRQADGIHVNTWNVIDKLEDRDAAEWFLDRARHKDPELFFPISICDITQIVKKEASKKCFTGDRT